MDILKDFVWLLVFGGGAVVSILSVYFTINFGMRRHEEKLNSHEKRICKLEKGDTKSERKLDVLQRNVVKIMEHLKIEPVRDLFEESNKD